MFALTQPSFPSFPVPPADAQAAQSGRRQGAVRRSDDGVPRLSSSSPVAGYGFNVLSDDVAKIFQGEFSGAGGGVPINRIDLSGYGASIFSEWADNSPSGLTSIVKVQLEAVRGRTAYEVVKARSTMYPYCAPLVRTITISRQNSGWVARTDTGWVAAGPGIFKFPNAELTQSLNRGAIAGVYNIKNVQEFETVPAGAFTYRRATFDADIGLDQRVMVLQGGGKSSDPTDTDINGNPVSLVPATGLTGYVQITPDESAVTQPSASAVAHSRAERPLATVPEGARDHRLVLLRRADRISRQRARHVARHVAALRGGRDRYDHGRRLDAGPGLRAAGRAVPAERRRLGVGLAGQLRDRADRAPANFPVPIVQPSSDRGNWHIADIADMLQLATPATVYGMLQDTGTQRILFEQPVIPDLTGAPSGSAPSIQLPSNVAPVLADVASLLKATGLFPDLGSAISTLVSGGPSSSCSPSRRVCTTARHSRSRQRSADLARRSSVVAG